MNTSSRRFSGGRARAKENEMKKMRSHPVNILENTSRFLILLLLPIIRALWAAFWTGGFYTWLSGAWFDLLILAVILGLGVYSWYIYVFSFNSDGIYVRKGVWFRQQRFLAFEEMTAVSIETPWYYRPFHIVHLKADTDGGSPATADFSITVKADVADNLMLYSKLPFSETTQLKRFYIPGNLYIAIFSLLTSSTLTGAIYLAASVSQIGDIFGKDIQDRIVTGITKIVERIAFGLPPVAAYIAYAILGCWLVSFVRNLLQHMRFTASRRGDLLDVQSGLLTRRRFSITVTRINSLTIRQSLITKLLGLFSVFVYCTGYGKAKDEMSVLMPAGAAKDLHANLAMLLPEIQRAPRRIKPKLVNLSRFLIPPGTLILCVAAAGLVGAYFLPSFKTTLFFLTVIVEIPSVWWLIVKIYAFFASGIGANEKVVTLYYTYGFRINTVVIPREKISKIEISQTLFQISTKCCDVTFCTYGEGQKRYKVLNQYLPDVRYLLELHDADFHLEPDKRWSLWR